MSNSGGATPAPTTFGDGLTNPSAPVVQAQLLTFNGSGLDRVYDWNGMADGASSRFLLPNAPGLWTGAGFDRQRSANVFKTVTAAASGDTPIWTPAAGKKFRLMAYSLEVTNNASQAVAGLLEMVIRDATAPVGQGFSLFIPGAAGAVVGAYESGWRNLGNGILSGGANNPLNLNLSAALATGEARLTVCGTEE